MKNSTSKKKAAATKGTRRQSPLERRAQAIINNQTKYTERTRRAVARAVREKHADLADVVTRAERGEQITNLTKQQATRHAEQEKFENAARETARFIDEVKGVPYWLTEAVLRGLEAATGRTNTPHYDDGGRGLDVKSTADLFRLTQQYDLAGLLDGYDLRSVFIDADPKKNDAARLFIDWCEHEGTPDYLRDAAIISIREAAAHVGVDGVAWVMDDPAKCDPAKLAEVFAATFKYDPNDAPEEDTDEAERERVEFAQFLSAALNHRAAPAALVEAIKEGMNAAFADAAGDAMQEESYIVAHMNALDKQRRKGGVRR